MNKPQIKIMEFSSNHNSFDDVIYRVIKSIKQIRINSFEDLINHLLNNIDVILLNELFNDLTFKKIDNYLKHEVERRIKRVNKELMPIIHPLFNENDFIKYNIENSNLDITTLNNHTLEDLFIKYNEVQ